MSGFSDSVDITIARVGVVIVRNILMSMLNCNANQSVLLRQIKNWDPLVLGPEFAIDKIPADTIYKYILRDDRI